MEAETTDTNGNHVTVLLQMETIGNLYLNVAGLGNRDHFYIDPALPHLRSGLIRAGDVFGLTAAGPFSSIENANGKEITVYTIANVALFPNVVTGY